MNFADNHGGLQVANAFGPLHAQFHLPPTRVEPPPSPTLNVPFRRDTDFIDRPELHLLQGKLCRPAARVALLGLGGVGKSQLVIEHCYRIRDRAPGTWVLWIHASTAARFEQSIHEVAELVRISGRDNPTSNIFGLVYNWLNDASNGPWLIVLDNADEAGYLFQPPQRSGHADSAYHRTRATKPLIDYIPAPAHGSVAITTRSRDMALRLVDHDETSVITTQPMTPDQALTLLGKKVGQSAGRDNELIAALDFMPLAIVQAAAYIQRMRPRCSVQEYLQKLEKSEKSRARLLSMRWKAPYRDLQDAENSIMLTWQISFDHIRQSRPSAAELLSLMSFFNHQGIPVSLLQQPNSSDLKDKDGDHDEDSNGSAEESFEEDIATLCDYLLISNEHDQTAFEMHRLVQLATRTWLEARGEHRQWFERSVAHLQAALPSVDYANWPEWRMLYPHVKMAMSARTSSKDDSRNISLQLAYIFHTAAIYALDQGLTTDSEALLNRTKELRSKVLGEEHPDTLMSMNKLASTYSSQGRWTEAEQLKVRVLEITKKVLGEEHPDTLMSMSNLASTYSDQGRLAEAEQLCVRVLELQKKVLGEKHPNTLASMNNLASTYLYQERSTEAEQLYVRVLELRKKVLGEKHPNTLASMNNLAWTYLYQKRSTEEEQLYVRVLELQKKVLGEKHPNTLASMNNLARTSFNQGRLTEAEQLYVRVLELRKKVLGEKHPNTLMSMNNLARTSFNQGRLTEAEQLYVRVLELQKKVLGEKHPNTLMSMNDLASTYSKQGRLTEAEQLYVRVLELRKKVLGEEHPSTLMSMNNLVFTYSKQGRLTEAEQLGVQVLELRKNVLGEEHPNTLTSMKNLAMTYLGQGLLAEAEQLMARVLELGKEGAL
ncbi:Hypothetical protein R9X50_00468700 [Acrodontium crateriforme]|uniref:DUF7779 domain-containing protein n=1 Tax=Acrodontium crateriforme TaxID=150365 RepID=A0AAQ3M5Z9_9PEZI|nr:Hypothetical protein R9X50_00468700 [Acrodontium crateriforme]